MNFRILYILVAYVLSSGGLAFSGELVLLSGTCRNATFGADGHLKLLLLQENTTLTGFMSISGWLGGSGVVQGTRNGDKVKFQTKEAATGVTIDWHADFVGDKLDGEYYVAASAATAPQREVGEWTVTRQTSRLVGAASTEKNVEELLKMGTEMMLNAPVKLADKTIVSGAENIFRAAHPAGQGISVKVEDMEIDWKAGAKTRELEDVHKFRATYTLYWQGVVTPTGTTRLRIAYNAVLDTPTSHEILESTGTTRHEFNEIAAGVGFILGQAAMNSLLK